MTWFDGQLKAVRESPELVTKSDRSCWSDLPRVEQRVELVGNLVLDPHAVEVAPGLSIVV